MISYSIIIELLTAFIGTLGFALLFNLRGKKLIYASLGGMLAWMLYLSLNMLIHNEAIRYFIVAIISTSYSEILARTLKTPASTFSILVLVPLVPGGALYNTVTLGLSGNTDAFFPKLIYTLELAVALSLGIVITTALFKNIKIRKRA